jgi:hypothetical protein
MLTISWNTQNFVLTEGDLASRSYEHTLQFDCVTEETHEGASVLTEHTVESGVPLTDHKRAMPRRISIEAWVTQTPLDVPLPSGYGQTTVQVQTQTAGASVSVFSQEFDRIADVLDTLDRLRLEATTVTLTTRRRTYDSVQIVSVTESRTPEDGDVQKLLIEIQEIRVAQTRTVDSPQPREPRGASVRQRGGQEAQDATTGSGGRQSRLAALREASEDYDRRRANGESASAAALASLGFGG